MHRVLKNNLLAMMQRGIPSGLDIEGELVFVLVHVCHCMLAIVSSYRYEIGRVRSKTRRSPQEEDMPERHTYI